MEITVQRTMGDAICTQGAMLLNGAHFCYTLEPRRDQSQGKPFCIPAGRYRGTLYVSPHFGYKVLLLQGVPGFDDVEIHIGNSAKDTHGCTLVAENQVKDWQSNSAVAFDQLMKTLEALPTTEEIWVTYIDPVDVNTGATA
jgi:hypothetical protein